MLTLLLRETAPSFLQEESRETCVQTSFTRHVLPSPPCLNFFPPGPLQYESANVGTLLRRLLNRILISRRLHQEVEGQLIHRDDIFARGELEDGGEESGGVGERRQPEDLGHLLHPPIQETLDSQLEIRHPRGHRLHTAGECRSGRSDFLSTRGHRAIILLDVE